MATTGERQEISLNELSLEQLNSLKTTLEQDLRQLSTSFKGLKEAQARFLESKDALEELETQANEKKEILIPLTSSIYVPGKCDNQSEVLVDIGTGYYVEKSIPEATKFMTRKIDFLQSNTDSLQELLLTKRNNLEAVIGMLQNKLSLADKTASK